jgi:hypothetical protein
MYIYLSYSYIINIACRFKLYLGVTRFSQLITVALYASARGRAMAQVVSRRPLTAEARFRAEVNPCVICGGQSVTGTGFSPSSSVSPVDIIPSSLFTSLHVRNEQYIW